MSKSLLYSEDFRSNSRQYLIIDSTALIDASRQEEFLTLLFEKVNSEDYGCSFITSPSVVYEFTRYARSREQLLKLKEILNLLNIVEWNPMKLNDDEREVFNFIYNLESTRNAKTGPSYTDAQLCLLAYHFREHGVGILTANHKDFPRSIFDRNDLITVDVGGELRTQAIYDFNQDKYDKLLDKFL